MGRRLMVLVVDDEERVRGSHCAIVSTRRWAIRPGRRPTDVKPLPPGSYDAARGELSMRVRPRTPFAPGSSHLLTLTVTDLAGNTSQPWVSVVRTE